MKFDSFLFAYICKCLLETSSHFPNWGTQVVNSRQSLSSIILNSIFSFLLFITSTFFTSSSPLMSSPQLKSAQQQNNGTVLFETCVWKWDNFNLRTKVMTALFISLSFWLKMRCAYNWHLRANNWPKRLKQKVSQTNDVKERH